MTTNIGEVEIGYVRAIYTWQQVEASSREHERALRRGEEHRCIGGFLREHASLDNNYLVKKQILPLLLTGTAFNAIGLDCIRSDTKKFDYCGYSVLHEWSKLRARDPPPHDLIVHQDLLITGKNGCIEKIVDVILGEFERPCVRIESGITKLKLKSLSLRP